MSHKNLGGGMQISNCFFFLIIYRSHIIGQVRAMNSVPHPEGLGLSENSATVRDLRDSKRLLNGVLLTQPGVAELVIMQFCLMF